MKTKNICITVLILFMSFFQVNSQEKEKNDGAFDVIHIDGKLRKNQLLLEFLTKNSRFTNKHLKKIIENQRNINGGLYSKQNLRNNRDIGTPSSSLHLIYYDGELILGEGINRLYLIDQVRLKDIKTIKNKRSGFDTEIHVETIKKKLAVKG